MSLCLLKMDRIASRAILSEAVLHCFYNQPVFTGYLCWECLSSAAHTLCYCVCV